MEKVITLVPVALLGLMVLLVVICVFALFSYISTMLDDGMGTERVDKKITNESNISKRIEL